MSNIMPYNYEFFFVMPKNQKSKNEFKTQMKQIKAQKLGK